MRMTRRVRKINRNENKPSLQTILKPSKKKKKRNKRTRMETWYVI